MNISMRPYQMNPNWYSRDLSANSSFSLKLPNQHEKTLQARAIEELNQVPKSSPALNRSKSNHDSSSVTLSIDNNLKNADYNYDGNPVSAADQKVSTEPGSESNSSSPQKKESADEHKNISPTDKNELSEKELALLQELKNADSEVRTHEMAHIAAGGQYVTSGAQLTYRKGPDGSS
ncbi:MAG: hypothetical protein HQK62_06785, partial [Desulfamplus sp.]|nr:hypothetical protein [Desulfamplus sp.]